MFKRILVPLDGSSRAERAIPVAARIAQASGGAIILVRTVLTTPELWPAMEMRPALAQAVIDAGLTEAKQYLLAANRNSRALRTGGKAVDAIVLIETTRKEASAVKECPQP